MIIPMTPPPMRIPMISKTTTPRMNSGIKVKKNGPTTRKSNPKMIKLIILNIPTKGLKKNYLTFSPYI
jgi:hypothetical protein